MFPVERGAILWLARTSQASSLVEVRTQHFRRGHFSRVAGRRNVRHSVDLAFKLGGTLLKARKAVCRPGQQKPLSRV